MTRTPSDLIAAITAAYRPDVPSTLELQPGDHAAIGKLAEQDKWLGLVREWLKSNNMAKQSFDSFMAKKKAMQGTGGEA